ncbi:hypothetical protein WAE56_20765, partial [Iodobacter sp. LRB]
MPTLASSPFAAHQDALNFPPPSPEHSARRLHETLFALHQENDPNRLSAALLQCFESALALLPSLEKPGHADVHTRQLSQCLLQELMQGFIRTALLRSNETGLFTSSRPRLEAFGHALDSAWQLACLYARSRTPLPPGFWRSCHQLFTDIHALGWAKRSLKNGSTPGTLYRKIMLLGISASNRLEPQKMAILFKIIAEEARFLDLVQLDQPLNEQGAFVYQTNLDEAPRFAQTLAGEARQVWWTIETQGILKQLGSRLQLLLNHHEDRHHEIQLIGRLLQEWTAPPRRQHFRIRRQNGEQIHLVSLWDRCWDLAAGHIDETAPEP